LYYLKSQALHFLVQEGRLRIDGYHRFPGGWAEILIGEGFRFHRPCEKPVGSTAIRLEGIDAKPRGAHEPQLKDAVLTLKQYLEGRPEASTFQWPAPARDYAPRGGGADDEDEEKEEEDWRDDYYAL